MAKDFFAHLDGFFDSVHGSITGKYHDSGDSGLNQAWDELDDFINAGSAGGFRSDLDEFDRRMEALGYKPRKAPEKQAESGARQGTGQKQSNRPLTAEEERMVKLAQDYRNIEAEIGSGPEEVKKAYKRVLMKYHPDRFAQDPAKQATATQITARLNESYSRIMEYLDRRQKTDQR